MSEMFGKVGKKVFSVGQDRRRVEFAVTMGILKGTRVKSVPNLLIGRNPYIHLFREE
jgi:hypothetical protein